MWIRSQDKERLIKPDYIIVDETDILATTYHEGFFVTIGTYSSEAKALKVLDMIQSAIMGKKTTRHGVSGTFIYTNNYFDSHENIVFQIPLDSEVELENE